MTETKVRLGLTKEVTVRGDYEHMSPMIYKKNLVELELTNTREGGRRCRGCPTTLYSWALIFLTFIFLVSSVGTIISWGTEILDERIMENMVLRNNSAKFEWWKKSPVKPLMAIRIFNYTNTEAFMSGLENKPRVTEVGPFVYRETLERVNVHFNPNGTVSYQERRSYEYVPALSNGSLDDYIIVPNMALLGASSLFRDALYFIQLTVSMAFMSIDYQPFIRVKVKDFIWGYEDPVLKASKALIASVPYAKIGLMVVRNGTSPHHMTVNTGVEDITRLGVVERYKGTDRHHIWDSDRCNQIDGTDGSIFPPHWVGEQQEISIYMPDMCRKFPLVFKEYVKVHGGVPAMRFHPPRDVFGHASTNEENACYCNSHTCPPAGVFNASPCVFGMPIMVSFPHFYLGDPVLLETVEGLQPREDKHNMYLDMHPKYGFPMAGVSRFQVNFMVRKSKIANFNAFTERSILPIAWFDAGLDDLPEDIVTILHHITFTRRNIEVGILCTSVITGVILAVILFRCMYRNCHSHRARRVADIHISQMIMTASSSDKSDKRALDLNI